jgi:AAA domain
MNPEIVKFPNAFFYKNRIKNCATDVTVAEDFRMIPYAVFGLESSMHPMQPLNNVYNANEVTFVAKLLRHMQELANPKQFSYGVITRCDQQRMEIMKQLQ